jgi:hypothetical protein
MPQLRACNSCARHVWIHESTCPFCGCELTSVTERPRATSQTGLSRRQRLMLVAAFAGQTLGACAETTTNPEPLPDGGPSGGSAASTGRSGFAGTVAAGQGGAGTAGNRGLDFMPIPPYGAMPPPPPPPPDAGKGPKPPDDDAGDQDAGTE